MSVVGRLFAASVVVFLLSGCGVVNLGSNLGHTLLNQDDPQLVKDAAPSYLLLVDSLIAGDPDDGEWLQTGASLYTLYSAAFVDSGDRAQLLSDHAFAYGKRALCAQDSDGCGLAEQNYADFKNRLDAFDRADVPALYVMTASWLVWAQTHSDDWNVVAALPQLELLLRRIIELDENYENGRCWMYLGILYSLRPPSLGGKPEQARQCFERALQLSDGKDLSVKVAYARYYARLVYDRELHDRLLSQVTHADPHAEGLTLMNTLARKEAEQLLRSGEDYF